MEYQITIERTKPSITFFGPVQVNPGVQTISFKTKEEMDKLTNHPAFLDSLQTGYIKVINVPNELRIADEGSKTFNIDDVDVPSLKKRK